MKTENEEEKTALLEKKILELKKELKKEQDKADILNKMLELARINPEGVTGFPGFTQEKG